VRRVHRSSYSRTAIDQKVSHAVLKGEKEPGREIER